MIEFKIPTLAVVNQKGGVGKTTTVAILAEYFALIKKKRVLIVDLDMQCNSSDYWVGMEAAPNAVGGQIPPVHPEFLAGDEDVPERSSIADIFYGEFCYPYPTFIKEKKYFVDVMLGHPEKLELINTTFDNESGLIDEKVINQLGFMLHSDDVKEFYDIVILDTGPSRSPIFRSAIRAATHAIVPFEPEEKSIQGINAMLQVINLENRQRFSPAPPLNLVGLLPNRVRNRTKLHQMTLDIIQTELSDVAMPADIYIPLSSAFPERDVKGISPRSIFNIAPSHKARIQAEKVGKYAFKKVFKK